MAKILTLVNCFFGLPAAILRLVIDPKGRLCLGLMTHRPSSPFLRGLSLILLSFLAVSSCSRAPAQAPALSLEERLALPADAANGERLFRQCAACHDKAKAGSHRVGPKMWGVYGQPGASVYPDFAYSPALREADIIWDEATLDAFLTNPKRLLPGTRMAYAGEANAAHRRDIIAFLKTLQD